MTDFFTTDFSFLGTVSVNESQSTNSKSKFIGKKVHRIGLVEFSIGRSEASRARTSASLTGTIRSAETCAKLSARTHTEEWRQKMSASAKQRGMPLGMRAAKPIHTPLGDFDSKALAAQAHNCDSTLISYRLKKFPQDYYYITKDAK